MLCEFEKNSYFRLVNIQFVFIPPALAALFWIVKIFFRKDVNAIQLFVVSGMLMALLSLFYLEKSVLFIFPFFYMAVRRKTSPVGITKWDWLMFLPPLLMIPLSGTLFFQLFFLLQITATTVWSVAGIVRYNRRLAEIYDTTDEISAEGLIYILLFAVFAVIANYIIMILPEEVLSAMPIQIALSLFLAILHYYIGLYADNLTDIPEITAQVGELPSITAAFPTDATRADDALIRKVVEEKMYLDPSVSLESLARKLNTNRTSLSEIIHASRRQNFSDFINSLRIEHFVKLADAEKNPNIKDLALHSGYGNLQSFYRNFSEIMQMSPKMWLAQNKKAD